MKKSSFVVVVGWRARAGADAGGRGPGRRRGGPHASACEGAPFVVVQVRFVWDMIAATSAGLASKTKSKHVGKVSGGPAVPRGFPAGQPGSQQLQERGDGVLPRDGRISQEGLVGWLIGPPWRYRHARPRLAAVVCRCEVDSPTRSHPLGDPQRRVGEALPHPPAARLQLGHSGGGHRAEDRDQVGQLGAGDADGKRGEVEHILPRGEYLVLHLRGVGGGRGVSTRIWS